jgi:hypothetical protein
MKSKAFIILFFLSLGGWGRQKALGYTLGDNIETKLLAGDEPNKIDTTDVLISKIEFKLKATKEELETFDDGVVPWINLDKPDKAIDSLIDADEIILPYSKVIVTIDYPLTNPANFNLASVKGFSRKQLIQLISEKYHEIYKEEEATSSIKTVPIDQRKDLINKNQTNGKYGIGGHDLSDLDLSSIEVYQKSNGQIYLTLNIES